MREDFDFEAALAGLQDGRGLTGKDGPVTELCRSFNRVLYAKGERLWERNKQQNFGKRRCELR